MNTEQWELLLKASSYVYRAAAKQAALNAAMAFVVIFLVVLAGTLLIITYWYIKPKIDKTDYYAPASMEMFNLIFGVIGITYILLALPTLLICSYVLFTYILNSDWVILQTLMTLLQ